MNQNHDHDHDIDTLAETEMFVVWRSEEEEGFVYHIELGGVTLHMQPEEWEELVLLIRSASR